MTNGAAIVVTAGVATFIASDRVVMACTVAQIAFVVTSSRPPASGTTITGAVSILATRLFVEPLIGFQLNSAVSGAGLPIVAGAAFIVLVLAMLGLS